MLCNSNVENVGDLFTTIFEQAFKQIHWGCGLKFGTHYKQFNKWQDNKQEQKYKLSKGTLQKNYTLLIFIDIIGGWGDHEWDLHINMNAMRIKVGKGPHELRKGLNQEEDDTNQKNDHIN